MPSFQSWTSNETGSIVSFGVDAAISLEENLIRIGAPHTLYILCSPSERSQAIARKIVNNVIDKYEIIFVPRCIQHTPKDLVDDVYSALPNPTEKPFMFISIGGGSTIGLAKALCLRYPYSVPIACVPTSYSGSEMTCISGITIDNVKKTISDSKIQPKLVIYDFKLCQSMTRELALTSSFNALAHAVEAMWSPTATPTLLILAEEGVKVVCSALYQILSGKAEFNSDEIANNLLYGAYICGRVLNSTQMGIHHKLAHILGGTYKIEHSVAHTILLPHSVSFNRLYASEAMTKLCRVIGHGCTDAAESLWDLQKDLGMPSNLFSQKISYEDIKQMTDIVVSTMSGYANPRPIEREAIEGLLQHVFHGRRPCPRVKLNSYILSKTPETNTHYNLSVATLGCPISGAETVVVCVHGRFSSAEGILRLFEGAVGTVHTGGKIAVLAPQALRSEWYPNSFLRPIAENEPSYTDSLHIVNATVQYALTYVPASRIILFGFSQGACLSLSYCMQSATPKLAACIALSGGICGSDEEVASEPAINRLEGMQFILGCSEEDAHVPQNRVKATMSELHKLGAVVKCDIFPGKDHKIFPTSAAAARCLIASLTSRVAADSIHDPYTYLSGYTGYLESEALPQAVPRNQKFPRDVSYGLYAETVTGTPFCAPRANNMSSWLYRIHPSVATHGEFSPYSQPQIRGDFCCPGNSFTPEPVRWNPTPIPDYTCDFVDGLVTIAGTGNPFSCKGLAINSYSCNKSMIDRSFYSSDGDFLVIPEVGTLIIQTEMGFLNITPGEIFILPRGLKMTVMIDGPSRGFACELFEANHFQLPNLGLLGSYGLADARHFKVPTAAFEDRKCSNYEIIAKFGGSLFKARLEYSPYDVVGWSGRYHPCKYDLNLFMSFGSVTWDHADPSLHTVLTCPIDNNSGASACDFVCFRNRFDAVRHTFRPPYYHRNLASEFNAIIQIDKPYSGFAQGVHWLTPSMTAHGISGASFNGFMSSPPNDDAILISNGSIWIMIESVYPLILTDGAAIASHRQSSYPRNFFTGIPRMFKGIPTVGGTDRPIVDESSDKGQPQNKKAKISDSDADI